MVMIGVAEAQSVATWLGNWRVADCGLMAGEVFTS